MSDQDGAAIGAIAALARDGKPQTIVSDDGRQWLVIPGGMTSKEITDPHGLMPARPAYVHQLVTLQTQNALSGYVDRFKTSATMIFADVNGAKFVAVLDYHGESTPKGPEVMEEEPAANHGAHRATLALQHSEEWKEWTGIDGKLLDKVEFVRFLEEHRDDVASPEQADLLEVCRTLQALKKVVFRSSVRDNTDHQNFEYQEETAAGGGADGKVQFPSALELMIPVFYGDRLRQVSAFLRWQIVEGKLTLGIKLKHLAKAKQDAFEVIAAGIEDATQAPMVYGVIA